MNISLLIFLMLIVTFTSRMIPALFIEKMNMSDSMKKYLQLIPYTAMTALIIPGIFTVDSSIHIGAIAGIVSIVAAWNKLPTIVVVILSIVTVYILYL